MNWEYLQIFVFACFVSWKSNSAHRDYSSAIRFCREFSKRKKLRALLSFSFEVAWPVALLGLFAGIAFHQVAYSAFYTFQVVLVLVSISLVNHIAEFYAAFGQIKSTLSKSESWSENAGSDFERQFAEALWAARYPSIQLYSLGVAILQLGVVAGVAKDANISRVAEYARGPGVDQAFNTVVATALGAMLLLWLKSQLFDHSRVLVSECLRYYSTAFSSDSLGKHRKSGVAIARWRTEAHRSAFRSADLLHKSVARARERIAKDEFEYIDCVYRKVANSMRKRSLELTPGVFDEKYGDLCSAVVMLATGLNPINSARVADDIAGEFPPEVARESKVLRFMGRLDFFVQHYSRVWMVTIAGFVVIALVASGQYADTMGFLQDLVVSR